MEQLEIGEMTSASPQSLVARNEVLVAEDNPDDFLLLARAIRKRVFGLDLRWAKDGYEALEYLGQTGGQNRNAAPAIVLSDINMPRMNGFELLAEIRARPIINRIPFVFLTSSAETKDIAQAYRLGANSYLVKPLCAAALEEMSFAIDGWWLKWNCLQRKSRQEP